MCVLVSEYLVFSWGGGLIQGKHSQHIPQQCPDHPSSPVKNALLALALLKRAKHLIRKRKLRAVFIARASEKPRDNIPRRTPVNV